MHKVQRWRTALTQLANLKGCDILNSVSSPCNMPSPLLLPCLSQRVFTMVHPGIEIPIWFNHRGLRGNELVVRLHKNWESIGPAGTAW
ncbi:uncharacterized protein LOC132627082 isoform X2 [Lycium barbarum]|uniref:uncharacterized protein LOC132627082 isoform X2 n=1 Tax=Lycium barbarum TaxID=112863 RepID=UPI00293E6EC4|nr:uncharacterized protein LOC132627082 isoform X2 [Lycium barbarum]